MHLLLQNANFFCGQADVQNFILTNTCSQKFRVTGPYPDANLGTVLQDKTSSFDYVLIQFYNNYCGYNGNDNALVSSFKQWAGEFVHCVAHRASTARGSSVPKQVAST